MWLSSKKKARDSKVDKSSSPHIRSLHEDFSVQTATYESEDRTEPHGTPCEAAWTAINTKMRAYDQGTVCTPEEHDRDVRYAY